MAEEGQSFKTKRIKVISFGPEESGKTCIIKRFCEKRFVSKYLPTIGIDYGVTKFCDDDEVDVKVDIFDLAGQPFFYDVRNEFYSGSQGAFLVYDASNRASFEELGRWMLELRSNLPNPETDMCKVVIVVCANKVDMTRRQVPESEGRIWAETRGFTHFETSALNENGIKDMFEFLFKETVRVVYKGGNPRNDPSNLGYSIEQANLVQQIISNKDNSYEVLLIGRNSGKDDILRAYKKLAILLHPDKNAAPGSGEAFKILNNAKDELLGKI